jgi:hypothetical protein
MKVGKLKVNVEVDEMPTHIELYIKDRVQAFMEDLSADVEAQLDLWVSAPSISKQDQLSLDCEMKAIAAVPLFLAAGFTKDMCDRNRISMVKDNIFVVLPTNPRSYSITDARGWQAKMTITLPYATASLQSSNVQDMLDYLFTNEII